MIDLFLLECSRVRTSRRRAAHWAAIVALSVGLAACATADRTVATSSLPADYHLRHPVVLADVRQTLDVFTQGGRNPLDRRQAHDLASFAADFKAHGEGRILVQLPQSGPTAGGPTPAARASLQAIKGALAAAGVDGEIEVGTYLVADPRLASAVRLSFTKLQSRLASRCGEWPDDLGLGTGLEDWNNRSYYNFGCASQQTLSAQVDDPRDLVRPRADDPTDVQLRTRAIGSLRTGQDPGTGWRSGYSSVGIIGQQ